MQSGDEIKEEILRLADIVEVVGEHVQLKKRGRNFIGLCPFHTEKTPSFNVSQELGIYKCFGCGKSGNVFSFMMEYHGMSFPEAIESLAKRYGIDISKNKQQNKQILSKKELAQKAVTDAAVYYEKLLHSQSGSISRQYYSSRKFSNELIAKFQLGYSPNSWDSTLNHLRKLGYSDEAILDAGLIIKRDNEKSYYDRFRDRAMFPIKDPIGRIIGFGARILNDDKSQPKYINSPQSLIYDKSKVLYGLFEAKREIINASEAILVEGYADVLTLHQAGIENVVASSGTSLTSGQLSILKRYCSVLTIIYDADPAGLKAAEAGLELAIKHGFDVRIATLPKGEDPDSLVRDHGKEAFNAYAEASKNFIDFKTEQYKISGILNSPAGMTKALRELLRIVELIPDILQHDFYIAKISSSLRLSESQLRKIYEEKNNRLTATGIHSSLDSVQPIQSNINLDETKDRFEFDIKGITEVNLIITKMLPEEKSLLQLALTNIDAYVKLVETYDIKSRDFITIEASTLFTYIAEINAKIEGILSKIELEDEIPDKIKQLLYTIAFKDEPSRNWEKFSNRIDPLDSDRLIRDSITKLEIRKIDTMKIDLTNNLKSENEADTLHRIQELEKMKQELIRSLNTF